MFIFQDQTNSSRATLDRDYFCDHTEVNVCVIKVPYIHVIAYLKALEQYEALNMINIQSYEYDNGAAKEHQTMISLLVVSYI